MVKSVKCNYSLVLPKAKLSFGESLCYSKYDTLFGNCIAYEIKSDKDIEFLENMAQALIEIAEECKKEFKN